MITDAQLSKAKTTVLIFPAGSEIGLEDERGLRSKQHIAVIGATSTSDHSQARYERLIHLPYWNVPEFTVKLREAIEANGVNVLIGAHDDILPLFAELRECGELSGAVVAGSSLATCQIARSKSRTYDTLSEFVTVPRRYTLDELNSVNFPIFSKPDRGQGSRGATIVWAVEDATRHLKEYPDAIFLEYLPGEELTVDCFTSNSGSLDFCSPRARHRVSNGISVETHLVIDSELEKMAARINEIVEFRGAWFFQVKKNFDGKYCLLEIAPRIAGSSAVQRFNGVNLPLLSVYDALNITTEVMFRRDVPSMTRGLTCAPVNMRKVDTVYLDLDDTLITQESVNWALFACIMRLKSRGADVYILTRHGARHHDSAQECLAKHNISSNWFDGIIEVPDDRQKVVYIGANAGACLVDDSFAERKQALKMGIMAIDVQEALELLGF